jgi:hypothetical protein
VKKILLHESAGNTERGLGIFPRSQMRLFNPEGIELE